MELGDKINVNTFFVYTFILFISTNSQILTSTQSS